MSTQKQNIASSKAASLASKAQEIVFTEVKVPPASEQFETAFKESSGIKSGTANRFTVNVLPSYVSILLYIMYHVQQNISYLEPKNHAKVSSMTLIAYCLTIVYGHLLLTDMHVNPDKSHFAEEIENDTTYRDFADFLLTLPVPEFLEPILHTFVTTTSARRRNVWFAYSPRGFNHYMHFGRFFPINIFTNLHDYAATTNSRADPNTVRAEFNDLDVFSIVNFSAASTGKTYKLRNFFASYFGTTTAPRYLNNKVNQALESIFNPVLLRAQQQRQTFTEIALAPPKFNNANYNPYLCFFALTRQSAPELRTILSTFKSVLNGSIRCNYTLASVFKDYSGASILTHGYSAFALPTWNHETADLASSNARCRPMSDEDYAAAILFKREHSGVPTAERTLVTQQSLNELVTIRPALPADPPRTITVTPAAHTYLINDAAPGPTDTDDTDNLSQGPFQVIPYSTERDYLPIIKVLNPVEEDSVSAWKTTLCGMIIEADELAGSAVPSPHPDSRVEEDNAQFAMSAIPFRHVHPATSYQTEDPDFTLRIMPSRPQYTAPVATTLLRCLSRVYLPFLTANRINFGFDTRTPGLAIADDVSVPTLLQTFFGFKIRNKATATHRAGVNEPPNTPYHRLLVWSPYTYIPPSYDPQWTHTNQSEALLSMYFITNLRTIFGTDVTLMELNHPLFAMPVA